MGPGIGALFGLLILGQSLALTGVTAVVLIVVASLGVTLTAPAGEVAAPVLLE